MERRHSKYGGKGWNGGTEIPNLIEEKERNLLKARKMVTDRRNSKHEGEGWKEGRERLRERQRERLLSLVMSELPYLEFCGTGCCRCKQ